MGGGGQRVKRGRRGEGRQGEGGGEVRDEDTERGGGQIGQQ